MNPLRRLTDWLAKSRRRPVIRRSCPLTVEALDERILLSTTAVMVKDINPPSTSTFSVPSSNPSNLTNVNGTLFFTAADATHGVELWKSDGTDAGTVMIRDIRAGIAGSAPANLTAIGSTLYFTADDGVSGMELWKSDGTSAGTARVRDIRFGLADSAPANLTAVGSTLFFTADEGSSGRELWKSNGSASSTVRVRDIRPGAAGSAPADLTAAGSRLFFNASDGTTGTTQLWKSDGTTAGTVLVVSATSSAATRTQLTALGSDLYYVADADGPDSLGAVQSINKSDGTAAGTSIVTLGNTGFDRFTSLANIGGMLYFSFGTDADAHFELRFGDYIWVDDVHVHGLFKLDGQNNLTNLGGNFRSPPTNLTDVNGDVFFTGNGKLWKGEGTTIREVPGDFAQPSNLTNVNGTLYFTATDGVNGTELWQSDGTSAGTRMVRNLHSAGSSVPTSLTNVNGTLYFAANNGFTGTELYKTRTNTAPSLNLTMAVSTVREGNPAWIFVTASDAEHDTVTFAATGLPAGLSINRLTGVVSGTAAYSAGRTTPYTITVTASDGFESTSRSGLLTVQDVEPPTVVNPGTQGSNEGNVVSLAISASDPHGDALSYSAVGLPTGLAINSSTGVISGTLGWQAGGSYQVTVTATDGVNPVATTFTWNVADLTAPTITNPGPQHSNRGNTVTLDIRASDPEGDALTYTAVKLPIGLSINRTTGRISGTISMSALPSCEVMILVSDGINTSSIVFVWTVG